MKLELITPTAMKQLCDKPVNIDRAVDKDAIKEIVDHFMLGGFFLMEVKIDDDERMILRNIIQALKDYIETNDIHASSSASGAYLSPKRYCAYRFCGSLSEGHRQRIEAKSAEF